MFDGLSLLSVGGDLFNIYVAEVSESRTTSILRACTVLDVASFPNDVTVEYSKWSMMM